jgi:hypothetical protein
MNDLIITIKNEQEHDQLIEWLAINPCRELHNLIFESDYPLLFFPVSFQFPVNAEQETLFRARWNGYSPRDRSAARE